MKLHIQEIKLSTRIRKDLGDIETLKESLHRHGLMNPVSVNKNNELIAGHRRLESAKQLGWEYIEVTYIDTDNEADMLALEIEENVRRKDLSETELEEALKRLEKLRKSNWFEKLLHKIVEYIKALYQNIVSPIKNG